jgi:hypothetical protein
MREPPTAFMANIIAVDQGLRIEDVADDYVHCGAVWWMRNPLSQYAVRRRFVAPYRDRQLVRACTALMVDKGLDREGWKLWTG